ncbi:MAG: transporter substrate-binding domain-containing protein [Sneathiella sp.]|nr:transporter substrate-binding domain-containing protein [Sneathiella sp.]
MEINVEKIAVIRNFCVRRLFFSSVLFAIAGLATGSALAADFLMCSPQIAPWTYVASSRNDHKIFAGPYPELKEELALRSGYSIELIVMPYARMVEQLKQGTCDFTWTLWSANRASYALRGTTFLMLEFGVMARPGISLKKYSDLEGLKIVVPRGVKVSSEFDKDKAIEKFPVVDYLQGLRMLNHNRAHGIAGTFLTFNYHFKKMGRANILQDRLPLKTLPVSFVYSLKSKKLSDRKLLDITMANMVKAGTVGRIIEKWFGAGSARLPDDPMEGVDWNKD